MRVFYEMYTKIDTDVHGHFQEMVRQIDEHRVKLKQRIDEYALAMIDKVKKCEISYLKNLSVTQEASMRRVEETNLVEESLRGVEELFRDPNLLIESIREMQRKQEKAVADIKVKLNEMSYVREHLKASNEFRANFSFSQELFGSLYLNDNTSNDLFKSKILTGRQPIDLIKLCEFSPNDKWRLLYRGTRDGFGAKDFHSKCDGHPNTLTILKAQSTSYIFGGFASVDWGSGNGCYYNRNKTDPHAFLFSLLNKDNQPCKMKTSNPNNSIFCDPSYGPVFGAGHDILIANNANANANNTSSLGSTYKLDKDPYTIQRESFLAGSYYFQLSEIEVYKKE